MTNPKLTLNLLEGSVSFNFSEESARKLQTALYHLTQQLKTTVSKPTGMNKPHPQPPMEYQHTGEVFLEIFCNPNIWPTPFSAKVLITVRDERIRLTTEAELTRITDDINQYLEQF
jgi:hypothetical protein